MICWRCSWPKGYGCTCPADEVTARARWVEVQRRHRAAVGRTLVNDRRRALRAERERKAS